MLFVSWINPRSMFNARFVKSASAMMVIGSLCLAGCGGGKKPWEVTHTAKGKVLFEGKPVKGAQVVLVPSSQDFPPSVRAAATTNDQGEFELSTYSDRDGAPAGDYKVTVTWQPLVNVGAGPVRGPNKLPPKYGNPETTPLQATILAGVNDLPALNVLRR